MNNKYPLETRKAALKNLLLEIQNKEEQIFEALQKDFGKPAFESMTTETMYVVNTLKSTLKNMRKWSKKQWVFPSLINFPSVDYILREPFGKVLIIAPWNYPFQLAITPLISAIAAGNEVVLKPSELTPHTSSILKEIIEKSFKNSQQATVVEGGVAETEALLAKRWDYVFFTGSVKVGKIVAKAIAPHLTPSTLELGGKNPCIIDQNTPIALTAKRIVWGKFLNGGQTCIAPDYLLVHASIKSQLIEALKLEIEAAYGKEAVKSEDYCRIVNLRNLERLEALIDGEKVIYGGKIDKTDKYFSPTLIDEPNLDSKLMEDEIFGPILPILSYENDAEIEQVILKYEKPLALYVFSSRNDWAKEMVKKYSFGGGCINDTIMHFNNHRMPFGGVGYSGLGAYHGKMSFDIFCHKKSVMHKMNWLDLPFRYAPYKGKMAFIKKILSLLG